jgi:hypothetical protein
LKKRSGEASKWRDGGFLEETFRRSVKKQADILQVVTWKDWSEGTIIEAAE